jgi:DNA-binding NtrC family response regulator
MPDPDHSQPTMAAPTAPLVLVVEDDDTVRGVVRRSLEHAGLTVREAESGRRALAMLREGVEATAVVTDLKMAEGSGGWLLAQLAYEYPRLLSRVVVISGNAGGAAAAHVAARWRCPVLAKPFTVAELVDAVRRAAAP